MLYHHDPPESRSRSIDLVANHKSGELRCPATALIICIDGLTGPATSDLIEINQ